MDFTIGKTIVVIIFKVLWSAMILLHADDIIHFTSKRSERNSQINNHYLSKGIVVQLQT